jgi:FAD/FMN-containing dehydrogenase
MVTRAQQGLAPHEASSNGAYRSWGLVHRYGHHAVHVREMETARAALRAADGQPVLAHGLGRSYGDTCLNADGVLLDMAGFDRFVAFDPATGVLRAQAGVSLAAILRHLTRPAADGSAWFPPVVPGTSNVTLGGAVANDVHGKNHHVAGTFGRHVRSLRLLRSDGQVLACAPERQRELFAATIGGLGLTGVILEVELQLRRVPGLALETEEFRFGGLDAFYALAAESAAWEYTVAWIDCLAQGSRLGRGIFSRARHAPGPFAAEQDEDRGLSIPLAPPFSPLFRQSLRAFNAFYWRRLGRRGHIRRLRPYRPVLFPLDAIGNWNRLYGRAGFYQYQCVLPPDTARDGIAEMLRTIAASGEGSFLAVLKTLGHGRSPGLLSFPMPGTTLALDFPNRGPRTLSLLERLDAITLAGRGRVYPAKDGRMSAGTFAAGFPELERFRASVDPGFSSSFWRRVAGGTLSPAVPRPASAPLQARPGVLGAS